MNSISTSLRCSDCPNRLAGNSMLTDIPVDILYEIEESMVVNVYKRGQTVFYEGNRPYGVYCINRGKVKIFKHGPEGKNYILKILKAGNLIGYRAFFTNEFYSATAEVIEDATICFFDRDKFFQIIKKHPPFSFKLLELIGFDLKCAEEQARNLAYKTSQERMIELIMTLKETYGVLIDDTFKIDIALSREEMANMIGTTTETVVRLLAWLKEKGVISIKKKYIFINSYHELASMIPEF